MKALFIVAILFGLYCFLARFVPGALAQISAPWLVVGAGVLAWILSVKVHVK